MQANQNFVIAGAGLAGLTAANALADLGCKVTVLEQSERLGGRAITQNHSGYLANIGPHALYYEGAARRTFLDWQIPFSGARPLTGGDAYLVYRGERYPFFANLSGLLRHPLFSMREKLDLMRVMRVLTTRPRESRDMPPVSMEQWIARHSRTERVADFLRAMTRLTTFATDFEHLDSARALEQIRMAFSGNVLYLDGGWQTLIDGLAERARSRGVEIRNGVQIQKLSGLDADGVILAVPPESAERIVGTPIPNLRPSRMACLQIGMRDSSGASARPAVSRADTASPHVKPATFALGLDQPLYFSVHSAYSKVAPEGCSLIYAGKYLGAADDGRDDRSELESLCDLAMPGWRDRAEFVQFLPAMTVTHAIAPLGGRPGVDILNDKRVAIAGDWVGNEGMLADAAASSALAAVRCLTQHAARAAA